MNDDRHVYQFDTVEHPAAARLDATEELPAVAVRQQSSRLSRFAVGSIFALCLIVVAGGAAVIYLALDTSSDSDVDTSDPVATVEADPIANPGADDAADPPIDPLSAEDPTVLEVIGTDNLYVRAGPGTHEDILGSIAGAGHASTGERALVNGSEWKQIVFDDQGTLGWVSANFVAPAEAATPSN